MGAPTNVLWGKTMEKAVTELNIRRQKNYALFFKGLNEAGIKDCG